ncbi:STAS domain-containing protein [Streptomyces sp. XH2]|uniref:STAS domain-containing protein n=1 Tax=Streptomyces sp. XH2 TaxID=3412483 RepID=UPI003C7D828B
MLTVRGILNLAGVPGLRERLLHVSPGPGSRLVLDLSGVTSCDALGLGMLVAAARRARSSGGDLCLVAPCPAVTQALKVSGLSRILPVLPGPTPPGTPAKRPLNSKNAPPDEERRRTLNERPRQDSNLRPSA